MIEQAANIQKSNILQVLNISKITSWKFFFRHLPMSTMYFELNEMSRRRPFLYWTDMRSLDEFLLTVLLLYNLASNQVNCVL